MVGITCGVAAWGRASQQVSIESQGQGGAWVAGLASPACPGF